MDAERFERIAADGLPGLLADGPAVALRRAIRDIVDWIDHNFLNPFESEFRH